MLRYEFVLFNPREYRGKGVMEMSRQEQSRLASTDKNGSRRAMSNKIRAILVLSGILCVAMLINTSTTVAATLDPSNSPEEVVRQFYKWYLEAQFPKPKEQKV